MAQVEREELEKNKLNKEFEDVVSKPESLLSAKVQQVLVNVINQEVKKALQRGDHAFAMELQRAKKLLRKGCWSVRKDNPFLYHMQSCLSGKGGTLKDTQEAMRKCSEDWTKLPPKKKKEYEDRAKGQAIYDFL